MKLKQKVTSASVLLAQATFVLAPLPFGSVDIVWQAVWLVAIVISILTAPSVNMTSRDALIIIPVFVVFLITLVLSVYLVIPNPDFGQVDPAWKVLQSTIGLENEPRISSTLSNPLISLGPITLIILVFLRSYMLCRDPTEARRTMESIGWAAAVYGCYGIISTLLESPWLLWQEKASYFYNLTGTFVNRNTAATYFGSCGIIWMMLSLREWEKKAPRGYIFWSELYDWLASRRAMTVHRYSFLALLCFGSLIMTGSRGGIITSAVSISTCLLFFFRERIVRYMLMPYKLLAFVMLNLMVLELFGHGIINRIEGQGVHDPDRWEIYKACVQIALDHPWLGIGLGNFEVVFPIYRPTSLASLGIIDRAHSTWLQAVIELGFPASLALFMLIIWISSLIIIGSYERRRARYIPVAALGVGMTGILHSSLDFSLQIPGYAVIFSAIVACGLAQRHRQDLTHQGGLPALPGRQ